MGQSRYQGRRSEERTFAHARIWLRLKKSGGASAFEGRSEDEGSDDQHGTRLDRRSAECGGSRPRGHLRLEMGSPKSALSRNAKDRQSAGAEAVEAILDGISCGSRTNRYRRYLPNILALSGNGNGAKKDSQNKCFLVAAESGIRRLTASVVANRTSHSFSCITSASEFG